MTASRSRRRFLAAAGAIGTALTAGCTGGDEAERDEDGTGPSPAATVRMTADLRFDPETVEVTVGDTVEWENTAGPRQSVTAYEDRIPAYTEYFASADVGREIVARIIYPFSGGLNRGDRYRNTFAMAGSYHYFSIPSEGDGMTGTVVVSD